jgi:uncharacterized protein YgiB involved in biofilm formation
MRPMIERAFQFLLVAGLAACLALGAAACGSACEDLANKICDCQPTRAKKESCKISYDTANQNIDPSSEQDDACQAILDSGNCTCESLQAGDLASCGLSNDALSIYD